MEGIETGLKAARALAGEARGGQEQDLVARGGCNPTPFLNRTACRNFLLEYAEANRAHKWDRVSSETLLKLNEVVRLAMVGHVKRLPSAGKTM